MHGPANQYVRERYDMELTLKRVRISAYFPFYVCLCFVCPFRVENIFVCVPERGMIYT